MVLIVVAVMVPRAPAPVVARKAAVEAMSVGRDRGFGSIGAVYTILRDPAGAHAPPPASPYSAASTASPISRVPTCRQPGVTMSAVR